MNESTVLVKSRPNIFLTIVFGIFWVGGMLFMLFILYQGIDRFIEVKSIDAIVVASLIFAMAISLLPYYLGRQLPLVRVYSDRIVRIYPFLFGYRRVCYFGALDYKSVVQMKRRATWYRYLWLVKNGKVKVCLDLDNQAKPSEIIDAIPLPYEQTSNPDIFTFSAYLLGLAKAEHIRR